VITNTGTNILAKYLIGQAPAYASFISIGVGPKPMDLNDPLLNYSSKTEMDFEVLRVPISSRGYVYDAQGNANIVFVGELPTDQRYEFSEVGVFSAKSNPAAGSYGSRMLYTFSESESWEYHDEELATGIPTYLEPLYLDQEQSIIAVDDVVFRTNTNNAVFNSDIRTGRYEPSRFLDRTLLIRGNMSTLESVGGRVLLKENDELGYYSSHIHLAGVTPNLNKNAPGDEIRLAFSLVNKLDVQATAIDSVKLLIEFASTDATNPDNFARMEIDLGNEDVDFSANRYVVSKTKLEDLVKSTGFTWTNVNIIKVYASVYEQDANPENPPILSDNFYVALDGLRFENLTAVSPLYGLTGYSVIRTADAKPIVKQSNSSNLIEFRFGLDVA
jgi:hypothetical protein